MEGTSDLSFIYDVDEFIKGSLISIQIERFFVGLAHKAEEKRRENQIRFLSICIFNEYKDSVWYVMCNISIRSD